MAISNIKATFPTTIENVWAIVTSLTDYSWRSDIDKIEVVNDTTFIEYSKTGIATTFTITVCKPLERWEFDMENRNMKGHWVGIFKPKNGYVEIDFTENVSAKKFLLKPFVKTYLKSSNQLMCVIQEKHQRMNSIEIVEYLKAEASEKYKTNIVKMGIPAENCIDVSTAILRKL